MELYTLVSLIIGIFGATYAALNALRTNFDGRLNEAINSADEEMEAIEEVAGKHGYNLGPCKTHRASMGNARALWNWANAIPAISFFVVMVFIRPYRM